MNTAFDALQLLDEKSQQFSFAGINKNAVAKENWQAIGCRVGRYYIAIGLHDVVEIALCPSYTWVPGTKKWVNGLANIRGGLALIVDLKSYFGIDETKLTSTSRVLFVRREELFVGLIVDQVLGKKYFYTDEKVSHDEVYMAVKSRYFLSFIGSAYNQYEQLWLDFNLEKLVNSQRFIDVAV